MKKLFMAHCLLIVLMLISGCGAGYVMSELTGTAKPEGGISEQIPIIKTYSISNDVIWKAVINVLDEQGYFFDVDSENGRIKTEPKLLGSMSDHQKLVIAGAEYYAIALVKVDGSAVSYRAKFNKESNVVQNTHLLEYPERENALRKEFFITLDKELGL